MSALSSHVRVYFQISVLTNFDFLYDDEAEDVMWGPDYEDRRLSYCSMDTGSLDRDLKSNLQTLECLSGSEQDLTPHDSSDDEDEVLCGDGIGTLYALKHLHCRATRRKIGNILAVCFCLCCVLFTFLFS